jgi:hypothetical protein
VGKERVAGSEFVHGGASSFPYALFERLTTTKQLLLWWTGAAKAERSKMQTATTQKKQDPISSLRL